MTTNSKDFRVKNGLVVEGTTATVDGQQILTTASSIPGRFSVSESPPLSPENGDGWLDSISGLFYMNYQDQDSSQWIGLGGAEKGDPGEQGPRGESGPEVEMSATAPAGEIEPGTLWYDSEDGSTYIYFSNSTNSQWVQL
jgi:hypothetical protein